VASGQALVGFIAVGSDLDYQIVGEPKTDAEELAGLAAGGEVLLAPTTLALAGDEFEVERDTAELASKPGTRAHRLLTMSS
jgi:class 3 adenylate cyclase